MEGADKHDTHRRSQGMRHAGGCQECTRNAGNGARKSRCNRGGLPAGLRAMIALSGLHTTKGVSRRSGSSVRVTDDCGA